jgi:hypothetical protein
LEDLSHTRQIGGDYRQAGRHVFEELERRGRGRVALGEVSASVASSLRSRDRSDVQGRQPCGDLGVRDAVDEADSRIRHADRASQLRVLADQLHGTADAHEQWIEHPQLAVGHGEDQVANAFFPVHGLETPDIAYDRSSCGQPEPAPSLGLRRSVREGSQIGGVREDLHLMSGDPGSNERGGGVPGQREDGAGGSPPREAAEQAGCAPARRGTVSLERALPSQPRGPVCVGEVAAVDEVWIGP